MILVQVVNDILTSNDSVEDLKNVLTAIGIVLTIIFGIYTVRQKRRDRLITIRNKLTDILEKLANLNMDNAKYQVSKAKDQLPDNYNGLLSDYRRVYVTHASNFVSQLPNSMTYSHELSLIAQAFSSIDDLGNAELYFDKSRQRADNVVDQILSERNYARFLFTKVDKKAGEELYDEIFKTHKGESDMVLFYLGETYKRWAAAYLTYGENVLHNDKLQLARLQFDKMKNTHLKVNHIRQIDTMLRSGMKDHFQSHLEADKTNND
ncbi:hypothetical protein [Pseudocnuella soli]|uniref:hypothetical protein n=1 Tax=Pseudocnuella soli TaxID=2502779 RepID=UPI00104DFB8A|nr:hypothetical protein [Pseudocnuella soli]